MKYAMIRTFLYSIWLPITVIVLAIIRLLDVQTEADRDLVETILSFEHIAYLFVIAWPCGIPLTFALRQLYHRARNTSFVIGIILIPLSGLAVVIGGLLGPFGIAFYAIIASLPAWIVLGIVYFIQRRRENIFN